MPTVENRRPPAPKAGENRPVHCDQNWLGYGRVFESDGLVEFPDHTDPIEFIQRSMQPQLFWGTNNRMTVQPIAGMSVELVQLASDESATKVVRLLPGFSSELFIRLHLPLFLARCFISLA